MDKGPLQISLAKGNHHLEDDMKKRRKLRSWSKAMRRTDPANHSGQPANFHGSVDAQDDEAIKQKIPTTEKERTTVVVKNIPRQWLIDDLCQEFSKLGMASGIDYINLPEDKKRGKNRGYGFVNFATYELAHKSMVSIVGHNWTKAGTLNEVQQANADWAVVQGFAANNAKHPQVESVAVATSKDAHQLCPVCNRLNHAGVPVLCRQRNKPRLGVAHLNLCHASF